MAILSAKTQLKNGDALDANIINDTTETALAAFTAADQALHTVIKTAVGPKGDEGKQGIQGERGERGYPGSNVTWCGKYDPNVTYVKEQGVEYNGSYYIFYGVGSRVVPTGILYLGTLQDCEKSITSGPPTLWVKCAVGAYKNTPINHTGLIFTNTGSTEVTIDTNAAADGELYYSQQAVSIKADNNTNNAFLLSAGLVKISEGNFKGEYDENAEYKNEDIVVVDGQVCVVLDTANLTPDISGDWELCVRGVDLTKASVLTIIAEDGDSYDFILMQNVYGYCYGSSGFDNILGVI